MSDTWELLPSAAQADYREYLRQGGRYDVAVWWERYKDYYREVAS